MKIRKRGKIVAIITPSRLKRVRAKKCPDFAARLKRIYGDKVFPDNIVLVERESKAC